VKKVFSVTEKNAAVATARQIAILTAAAAATVTKIVLRENN
jgi:hypothetical protein